MNREQKIALIIGFAVVLVVGVLVSDHLSGARHLELADATEGDSGRLEAAPVAYLPDVNTHTDTQTTPGETSPVVQPLVERHTSPAIEPFRFAQGGEGSESPLGDVLRAADAGDTSNTPAETDDSWKNSLRGFGEKIAHGLGNGVREAAVVEPMNRNTPAPREVVTPPARNDTPKTTQVHHIVQNNESLYKIAKAYLGDGNRWREIAEANSGKVGKDGSVRTGVSLVIPGANAPRQATPPASPSKSPEKKDAGPIRYTVKKNDSLSEIAQRYLGTTKRMSEIIAANRSKIDDPDDIRVGMVLVIPARS